MAKPASRFFLATALLAVLALAGCAQINQPMRPVNKVYALGGSLYTRDFPDAALVVLGLRATAENGVSGGTFVYGIAPIQDDKIDGRGQRMWVEPLQTRDDPRTTGRVGERDFHILRMPPGEFAVVYIRRGEQLHYLVNAGGTARTFFEGQYNRGRPQETKIDVVSPTVAPTTPILTVRANEVVYVGDLEVDVTNRPRLTLGLGLTVEDARTALAAYGSKAEMSVRQMRRQIGPAPREIAPPVAIPTPR
jgi:hypothetical protein